ncbi:IS91 family transposase [candidate division CSSED10-310 bacterium]|uniref:IS91 family transposase n=1 Tax=candidate division CSSED10-310 bacterium TaxID=2855610 RepID=A0ABV6Z468_UNCC1
MMITALKEKKETKTFISNTKFEVADIFSEYGEAFIGKHPLPLSSIKVMKAIMACRTEFIGGHLQQCDDCGHEMIVFNSCRDRHCPKCQTGARARWLEKRSAELLPLTYFHLVFTLPHELNPIALCNKEVICKLLFQAVSKTLLQFGKNNLDGKVGFIAVLHTWDQKLLDHFHLHCLIPGGALSFDSTTWIHANNNYLFNVKALAKVYRGKFMDYLNKAFQQDKLNFPGKTQPFGTQDGFTELTNQVWQKKWVVYAKPSLPGPKPVLAYLAGYVHRVAISNHRIIQVEKGMVTFVYKDRNDNNSLKEMTITSDEFIRRFLIHIMPKDFMRIRYYGFLANRAKKKDLPICRELLKVKAPKPTTQQKTTVELLMEVIGVDVTKCPRCKKGTMKMITEIPSLKKHFSLSDVFHLSPITDTS